MAIAFSRTGVMALTTGGNFIVRMGSSIILTRLLAPEIFGMVSLIMSIFITLGLITDLGFQNFVVRHQRGDEPHFQDVIWTIHVLRGFVLTGIAVLAAPLAAAFMQKPQLTLPFAVASSIFLIGGLQSLSYMTALRQDAARKLAVIDLATQAFQTVVSIALAYFFRSIWAIIASMILYTILRSIIGYYLFDRTHRLARDKEITREFLTFSRLTLASSMLWLLLTQTDKLFLGRILTLHEFGLYAIAASLAAAPVSFAESYVSRVSFPVYARIWREQPELIGSVYYNVARWAAPFYAFGCGGIIGAAGLIVGILYDPRYASAASFLAILTIGSALRFPTLAATELLIAMGDLKSTLRANAVRAIWLFIAAPLGFFVDRVMGIVVAVGLIEAPALVYSWVLLWRRGVFKWRGEAMFFGPLIAGVAIGAGIARTVFAIRGHV